MQRYPRNMIGYGADRPDAKWPGGANDIAEHGDLNLDMAAE